MEREHAEEKLNQRNQELFALQAAGAAVASSLEIQRVVGTVSAQMIKLLGVDGCTISDWDKDANIVFDMPESAPEHWYKIDATGEIFDLDDYPSTKRVLINQQSFQVTVSQPDADPAELAIMHRYGIKSMLLLPMAVKGETIGLVELADSRAERKFTEQQISLAQLLANQAASAIQNARLYQRAQKEIEERERAEEKLNRRNQELFALQAAGTAVASSLDIRQIVEAVTVHMVELLGVDGCTISDWHKETDTVTAMVESPTELWYDVDASSVIYHLDDYSATRQVLEKREVFQATTSQSDADPAEVALMRETGIKSLLMLPMAVKGEVIGLVELADSHEERTFTEHQVALAQFLANQAGSAIQNARLYQRAQQEITDRQEAQRALRESEARLSGVLESAMDAIITVDENQRIMFFNPAAEQMFRLRSSEVVGGNLDRLIPEQYHKVHADHVREFGEGKPSARQMGDAMTVWGVRNGGEVFPIEASISWIRVTNQRYFTAIVRDVTERVLTEQTLGQRIEEMSSLNQAAQTVATVTDLPAALESVAQLMNNLFKGRSAIIAVPDIQQTRLKVLAFHDRDQLQPTSENELYSLLGSPSVQRVFEQGQALVIHDAQISNLPATSQKQLRGQKMSAVMLMPLRARGIIVGVMGVGTDEPDRIFSPEEVLLAESIGGYVAGAIATAQLFAREQQQRQVAESLRKVATTVTSSLDHQTVLSTIFKQLGRVVNYDGACISLLQDDELVLIEANGISSIFVGNRIRLSEKNPPVQVFRERQAMVLKDVSSYSHWESWGDYEGIRSWMGAPLVAGNKAIGLLTVDNLLPDAYTDEDAQVLQTFAHQAAIAIENAHLYEQAQRVAIDEERQRLARELHDSVTQSLYSLTLLANGWGTMAEQGRLENVADSFKQLGDVGQQALKEMRLLIHQLRPPILEKVGLVGALQHRLEAVEQRVSIKTRLLTDGDLDQLPLRVEEELFYIALEALNNSLRHASATAIFVRLKANDNYLTLEVQDNGAGFEPRAVSTGMGLQTMKERAKVMGGDLVIDTRQEQGTVVKATVSVNVDRST